MIWMDAIRKYAFYTNIRNTYSIVRQIGQGGFGHVHLCQNRFTGKLFAVKSISVSCEKERKFCLNEVRLLWNVRHPSVVRIH
jgi:serine/threonine protein kinase